MRPPRQWPTWLYRCIGADDEVLYIGVTMGVESRLRQHAKTAEWWPEVERVERTLLPSRRAALDAERAAIAAERPRCNKRVLPPARALPPIIDAPVEPDEAVRS
jgi:predicted GIY-YIG superfamily endonuclease